MATLQEQLDKVRADMRKYIARGDELDEEDAKKLEDLNKSAVKLEARISTEAQLDKADLENKERIEREKREAVDEARRDEAAKARRLQMGEAPYQAKFADTNKFDELSAGEVSLVIDVLNANNRPVSGAAFKALSLKVAELKNKSNTEDEQKSINYVKNAFKGATGIGSDLASVEGAIKAATDPMYTGGSGIGSDWVGTAYSSQIWDAIRAANVVFNKIPQQVVPDGYSGIYIPLESTDPNWYKVAETTAANATTGIPNASITASQMATANKQLTLGKLAARGMYSGELVEDSLIAFAPQFRSQLEKSGAEIMEHVMIDGDTETSANKNINDIAGTPAGTEPFLLLNGFRKLALVTNTANSRSAAGGFVIEDFKDTLKLMGTAGVAGADPTKVGFILDYNTMWAALDLPEIKTRDVSQYATIEEGFLARVYRTQVLYALQMHRAQSDRKAQTDGKIDLDTAADNTTGSILAVRFDQWKQAFKRRMTLETTRRPESDSYEIVAIVRWGMTNRDNEASAITYNVGI